MCNRGIGHIKPLGLKSKISDDEELSLKLELVVGIKNIEINNVRKITIKIVERNNLIIKITLLIEKIKSTIIYIVLLYGRGRRIRTLTGGFGDRCATIDTIPLCV